MSPLLLEIPFTEDSMTSYAGTIRSQKKDRYGTGSSEEANPISLKVLSMDSHAADDSKPTYASVASASDVNVHSQKEANDQVRSKPTYTCLIVDCVSGRVAEV